MSVPREGGKFSFSCSSLESSSVVMEENERKMQQLRSNFRGAGPKLGLRWGWAELEIAADPSAVGEAAQENSLIFKGFFVAAPSLKESKARLEQAWDRGNLPIAVELDQPKSPFQASPVWIL